MKFFNYKMKHILPNEQVNLKYPPKTASSEEVFYKLFLQIIVNSNNLNPNNYKL